jgi:heptose I phosphotransferase
MVMNIQTSDRFHAKQGRSTARVILHQSGSPLPVYLKRHFQLPWKTRLAALLQPAGRHSPATAEWSHIERVRSLGISVPEVVAAGERIGPKAALQSFLMVAELTQSTALNELLPRLVASLDHQAFALLKRRVVSEMARITARLHNAHVFHKDLYLCHFFLDHDFGTATADTQSPHLTLIDLHRLEEHRYGSDWWRWKDLGQLLFSTEGVPGISARDRLRFWTLYCRHSRINRPALHALMTRLRAARYREHNRKGR